MQFGTALATMLGFGCIAFALLYTGGKTLDRLDRVDRKVSVMEERVERYHTHEIVPRLDAIEKRLEGIDAAVKYLKAENGKVR